MIKSHLTYLISGLSFSVLTMSGKRNKVNQIGLTRYLDKYRQILLRKNKYAGKANVGTVDTNTTEII